MLLVKLNKLHCARFNKLEWIFKSALINKDVWLAGGALRTLIDQNETICDYDLFFRSTVKNVWKNFNLDWENNTKESIEETKDKLIQLGFKLTYECPEGKLYTYELVSCNHYGLEVTSSCEKHDSPITYKVQLITEHFYSSPEELLSTFDLSPTYFCTDGEYLWTSRQAIRSVKKKVCSLLKLSYPVSTFNRIIKYCGKGYSCLPAIETYVGSLLDSNREVFTYESMRRYID